MDTTEKHPLQQIAVKMVDSRGTRKLNSSSSSSSSRSSSIAALDPLSLAFDGIDPLSQFAIESENADPLSQMAAEVTSKRGIKESPLEESMESWAARRPTILAKYTTTERLSIVTSFLSGGETSEWRDY